MEGGGRGREGREESTFLAGDLGEEDGPASGPPFRFRDGDVVAVEVVECLLAL